MSWRVGVSTFCAAAFLVVSLGASPSAAAKPLKPITGKLNKRGYTVIALADNGRAKTVTLKRRTRFRLCPPAKRVTLHLRAPDGTYAGPIVIAREARGKRVILGARAGAKLGLVKVRKAKGYATLGHRPAKRWIESKRWARAKNGIPIGNGLNVGLVRSRRAHGPRGDLDLDGVPNPLDVDDDGDLILDNYDSTSTTASASALQFLSTPQRAPFMSLMTRMWVGGEANVDGGSSDEQIAADQRSYGQMAVLWGGVDPGSAELDCGTLVYCSAGGTGKYLTGQFHPTGPSAVPVPDSVPFPACCDADSDGLGSLIDTPPSDAAHDFHGMTLGTGATDEEMRAGDVLIERATRDGVPLQLVSSLGFVFSTYPALASYDDGQGDSGAFTYPRQSQPLPVRAGPNGDVVLRLAFWRPQRRRIEGEPGEGKWMDVGNLDYAISSPPSVTGCPLSSYSDRDPNLVAKPTQGVLPSSFTGYYLQDVKGDRPSSPTNTFSYTLNLTDCFAANGQTMHVNDLVNVWFMAFAIRPAVSAAETDFIVPFELKP